MQKKYVIEIKVLKDIKVSVRLIIFFFKDKKK